MHESMFTYRITRPYPFRWFTWVVLIGGIVAIAIISIISVAATGYETSILYSVDPNATEHPSNPAWSQRKPWSWASKISPQCQSQSINIGSQFYTNNFGFSYKILSILTHENDVVSSFTYHNDFLHDCVFTRMSLDAYNITNSVFDAAATINCTLYENSKPITLVLDATARIGTRGISRVSRGTNGMLNFLLNPYKQPALFWGDVLLTYEGSHLAFFAANRTVSPPLANWVFKRKDTPVLLDLDFPFQLTDSNQTQVVSSITFDARSFSVGGVGRTRPLGAEEWGLTFGVDILEQGLLTVMDFSTTVPMLISNLSDPRIAMALMLDGVGKSVYSTILTDLGQSHASNSIADPRQIMTHVHKAFELQEATNNSDVSSFYQWFNWGGMAEQPEPNEPVDFFKWIGTELPQVSRSRIATRYLCQVPKLKPGGSLFFSVVVADIVLLQVFWFLLNFFTTFALERKQPQAKYCVGCTLVAKPEELELSNKMYSVSTTTSREPLLASNQFSSPVDTWSEIGLQIDSGRNVTKISKTPVKPMS